MILCTVKMILEHVLVMINVEKDTLDCYVSTVIGLMDIQKILKTNAKNVILTKLL